MDGTSTAPLDRALTTSWRRLLREVVQAPALLRAALRATVAAAHQSERLCVFVIGPDEVAIQAILDAVTRVASGLGFASQLQTVSPAQFFDWIAKPSRNRNGTAKIWWVGAQELPCVNPGCSGTWLCTCARSAVLCQDPSERYCDACRRDVDLEPRGAATLAKLCERMAAEGLRTLFVPTRALVGGVVGSANDVGLLDVVAWLSEGM